MRIGQRRGTVRTLGILCVGTVMLGGAWWVSADDSVSSYKARLEELRKERAENGGKGKAAPAAKAEYPWATPDDTTYIDEKLREEWDALKFAVAGDCTDGEFVRRASLDIIGRIPTLAETDAFLKDRSADRRVKLVNKLLASPEYGKNWATIWTHLLITAGRDAGNMQDINPEAMRSWLENQFNRNVGWDRIVEEMLSATGRWDEKPAVNFLIANKMNGNNTQVTSYTTRLFLGVQTQCTECHDHPWNDWKQDQFWGVNSFFTSTREIRRTTTTANGTVATDYYEVEEMPISPREAAEKGMTFERRNGMVSYAAPTYLDGRDAAAISRGEKARTGRNTAPSAESVEAFLARQKNGESDEPMYLRKQLAKAVTSKDNQYFAKAIVNRLWYHYMGHSFVKNVDDFDNGQDEPSMPELLDKVSSDLKTHNFDLKRLTRWICTSKAYGLSSKHKGKENKEAGGSFTTMLCKPMSPEQLYDSVLSLTEIDRASKSENKSGDRREFVQEFMRTFGTDQLQTAKPTFNGTITQSLMMMNSPLLKRATSCQPGSFLHRLAMDHRLGVNEKVDAIYLAAFSRKPTGAERNMFALLRQKSKGEPEFLEDVMWIALNSGEFLLNY